MAPYIGNAEGFAMNDRNGSPIGQQAARSGPSTKTLPTKKGQTKPSLTGPKTLLNETI